MESADIWLVNKLALVERTGWTLDYIDGLDMQEFDRILATFAGLDKARAHLNKGGRQKAGEPGVRRTRVI